jgi:response regulator NasT
MRVLLADSDAVRAQSLAQHLIDDGLDVVRALAGESLNDAVARVAPEVVIVDMARPDRDSLDGIRRISSEHPKPIVMFVDEDDPGFMEEAIAAGVSSYNLVGAALPDIKPIVKTAVALFSRYQGMEAALRRAEQALQERAVIDQAKAVLMRQRQMSEPQAYRWLRSRAMDRGKRIADIAADVVARDPGDTPR